MRCRSCQEVKSKAEMRWRKPYCRTCWKKMREKQYRQKHKRKIQQYYKKWYEEKGKKSRKRKKDYSSRNRRIYETYTNPQKRFSITSLANMYQMSRSRIAQIIKSEQQKQERDR